MNPANENSIETKDSPAVSAATDDRVVAGKNTPLVTLFTMPKPFGANVDDSQSDKTDHIQRNAIKSWLQLEPVVEVLLIGNENGIAETAHELGVRHVPDIEFNEHGTPLVSSAFEIARRETVSPLLAYCNCDVILTKDFANTVEALLSDQPHEQFVAFGQRTDLDVESEIDFRDPVQFASLMQNFRSNGVKSSSVCKEYFIFNRDLYQQIPKFAVGRGNWDNWMLYSAKQNRVPVINVSAMITAIHQAHDYSHTDSGRYKCYVSGEEAQENMRLAGGRHLISGSTPTWRMTKNGIKKELPLIINPAFWADVPRFARLMMNLLTS